MRWLLRAFLWTLALALPSTASAQALFSPDGSRIAVIDGARVAIRSAADGALLGETASHGAPVLSAAFSKDGLQLLTGAEDGSVRLWAVNDAAELLRVDVGAAATQVRLSPAGVRFAVADAARNVSLWDRYSGEAFPARTFESDVVDLAFAPGGTRLLVGTADGYHWLWDLVRDGTFDRLAGGARAPGSMSPAGTPAADAILGSIEAWRRAWAARDPDAYLGLYDAGHAPAGFEDASAWRAERSRRLLGVRFIEVGIASPVIERLDEGRVRVSFEQSYRSDVYADRCRKTLELVERPQGWRIVDEVARDCAAMQVSRSDS